jgi:hypothetical protein
MIRRVVAARSHGQSAVDYPRIVSTVTSFSAGLPFPDRWSLFIAGRRLRAGRILMLNSRYSLSIRRQDMALKTGLQAGCASECNTLKTAIL